MSAARAKSDIKEKSKVKSIFKRVLDCEEVLKFLEQLQKQHLIYVLRKIYSRNHINITMKTSGTEWNMGEISYNFTIIKPFRSGYTPGNFPQNFCNNFSVELL